MNSESLRIAAMMDAVAIGPEHNFKDMQDLVRVAKEYNIHLIYGLSCFCGYMLKELKGTGTIVGGGIFSAHTGFEDTEQKLFMAKYNQEIGCGEIDMFINIPYIRSGMEDLALEELKKIRNITKCPLKVIIEAPVLSDEQIKTACEIVIESGADFIKTGTGFLGATTLEIVKKVMDVAKGKIQVKAAGGIMGYETVIAMEKMGVSRFGMGYKKAERMLHALKDC